MFPTFIPTVGHQHFENADGPRHLMFGPIVPEGEIWTLRLIAAKNNMIPGEFLVSPNRYTAELSVCVFTPPRHSDHEDPPPGTWVLLESGTYMYQYETVKWEGYLELRPGTQLGAWFRGAQEGDALELNALWDVEVFEELDPDTTITSTMQTNSSWHRWKLG